MRRVLLAAGIFVAPFIATRLEAQNSALLVRDLGVSSASSLPVAPRGSRDMVRTVRPTPREHVIPSTLESMVEEGSGSSAVKRGAWIGAGIGLTAGLTAGVMIASTGMGCNSSSGECGRVGELVAGTVFMSTVAACVGALLGAGIGKVVQLTVSYPSGQPK